MPLTWWPGYVGPPSPHLEGKPTREDILVVIGLAQVRAQRPFSCEECASCSMPSYDHEYGYWEPGECCARPSIAYLKAFPFKRVPASCHERNHFSLEFWRSDFSLLYYPDDPDGKEERISLRVWRMADAYGRIKLNARNQHRVDEALARFMSSKPHCEESQDAQID